MPMRPHSIAAVMLSALCAFAARASAQSRFDVVAQNAIPEISGLRVVVVRDSQLSACYTLFVMEPPASALVAQEIAPEPIDTGAQQSIQRIRDASQTRDRQLADLYARFERQTGQPYEAWLSTPGVVPDQGLTVYYERERKKIDDEYEHVLRTEIPGSYPWASLVPGMRTGSWEDLANAVRRATLDADPTSAMKTLSRQLAKFDDALRGLLATPHLAASGPVMCNADATKR